MVIVTYTHTDTKDVWIPFFDRLKKYMGNYKTYVLVNKQDDDIPNEYMQLYYDEKKTYTERLVECLVNIDEEIILFMHEDMILYDKPMHEYLEKYEIYIKQSKMDCIKLLFSGNDAIESQIDSHLVTNEYSKFSIQPTIMKTKILIDLANMVGAKSIWDFENSIIDNHAHFSVRFGDEKKRGILHYDSKVYPYIATAIVKGKWNMTEYQSELHQIFTEYGINPFERGIV